MAKNSVDLRVAAQREFLRLLHSVHARLEGHGDPAVPGHPMISAEDDARLALCATPKRRRGGRANVRQVNGGMTCARKSPVVAIGLLQQNGNVGASVGSSTKRHQ